MQTSDSADSGEDEEENLDGKACPSILLVGINSGSDLPEHHSYREDQKLLISYLASLESEPPPGKHLAKDHGPDDNRH